MAHSNKEDWQNKLSKALESFDDKWEKEVKNANLAQYNHLKTLHNSSKWSEWAAKGGSANVDNMLKWCRDNNHWEEIGKKQRGVPKKESTKEKISNTLKGRKLSDETKQKMSESRMGHGWSDETIEKLKKAARKRCTPILQFDLSGNFIKEWSGLAEIHDELGFNKRAIQVVCNNYRDKIEKGSKQSKGFIWKYKQ